MPLEQLASIQWHLFLVSLVGLDLSIQLNFVLINPTFIYYSGVELVGKSKREMSGNVLNYFYALGEAAVGLFAWSFGNWTIIQLLVSAPPLLFVLYYWLVPESVRWLLIKKKSERAQKIIRKAAEVNGVELSEQLLANFEKGVKLASILILSNSSCRMSLTFELISNCNLHCLCQGPD